MLGVWNSEKMFPLFTTLPTLCSVENKMSIQRLDLACLLPRFFAYGKKEKRIEKSTKTSDIRYCLVLAGVRMTLHCTYAVIQ